MATTFPATQPVWPATGESVKVLAQFREVSGFHQRRRHDRLDGGGLAAGEELEVTEEESLVLPNRSTDGGAILILGEVAAGDAVAVIEVGVGIERAVAQVFPNVAMKGIGSRFDGGIHHCACRRAEFRGVGPRLNAEFLESIGRRLDDLHRAFLQVGRSGVVVDSVEREIILRLQIPVRAEAVGRGVVLVHLVALDAGFEKGQIGITPAIQGQINDLLSLDHAANIGVFGLQNGRGREKLPPPGWIAPPSM